MSSFDLDAYRRDKENKRADKRKLVEEKEQGLLTGSKEKAGKLLEFGEDTTKITLDDETGASQKILEYVACKFPNLKELTVRLEYDDKAPILAFHNVKFPALEQLSLYCVGLSEFKFGKENYPCLSSISLDNIVGDVRGFDLDLPTLKHFSADHVTLKETDNFAESLSRCTNLESFGGYKLWGLSNFSKKKTGKNKLYMPNCNYFDVSRSDDIESLEIYAPKLHKLGLQGCFSLKHVRLLDKPFDRPLSCFCCAKVAADGPDKFIDCDTCKIANYCTKECEKNHAKEHKKYCGKKILINTVNASVNAASMKLLQNHPRVKRMYKGGEAAAMAYLMA